MFEYSYEYDTLKTKVLKYVVYKKRTEHEVKTKFADYNHELLEKVIEFLKENNYIDDKQYVKRYIDEIKKLKNMSYKEVSYKLYSKGIDLSLLYPYEEELKEYEIQSATNIIIKKASLMEIEEIKNMLLKKGYKMSSINQAIDNYNNKQ